MPDSFIRIILNSFYLLNSSFEKSPTWIWRLQFAMHLILNRENATNRSENSYNGGQNKWKTQTSPPPQIKDDKRRVYALRAVSSLIGWGEGGGGGDGGLLFHFILSKTVGSITSRCSGIRAVTGKTKDGTQGTAEIEPRKHPSSLSKQSTIAWQVKIFNLYMRSLLRRGPGAVE